jgi:N-acetylglutamate synthase-like GNAT family acetyltransferase
MSTNVPVTDQFLAQESERTFYDYSFAWEGEAEQVTDYDDVRVIQMPVPWFDVDGVVERMSFDPARVDERLDALFAEVGDRNFWWIVGPSSQPADLTERLTARGLQVSINWDCLGLSDLTAEFPANPDVQVDPLSKDNAEEYAAFCAFEERDSARREQVIAARLAAAHRYLESPRNEAHIFLGRLDGVAASCVVLRVEPNGVAYLRNAVTLPEFRQRGLYLTLVGHRLAAARAAGCTSAVVQAQVQSSSPILRKRGFRRVSWLRALTRPAQS